LPRTPISMIKRTVGIPRSPSVRLLGAALALCGPGVARGDRPAPVWEIDSGPTPPLHPTTIMGTYKDHPCEVVGVSGNAGLVDNQGTTIRLPENATYQPKRASAFMPGSLEISKQTAESNMMRRTVILSGGMGEVDGGVMHAGSSYETRVVASQPYPGCYLVLLFFNDNYLNGETDDPGAIVAFHQIGDLAAGVETKVSADFAYIDFNNRRLTYIPLFFSRGKEIRTSFAEESARLFRHVEMLRHKKLIPYYFEKNPRTTSPAKPYLRFPPVFPPGTDMSAVPAVLKVDFTVTSEGTVEGVRSAQALPPDVLGAVQRAVQGWLYFPQLDNGQPMTCFGKAELGFKAPAPKGGAAPASPPPGK